MKLNIYNPKQALNKAYLKEKVSRDNIELFKKNLSTLIGKIDEQESEEHLKNVISDFLKDTWYKETNEINTKDRKDLVIHTGKTTKEPVGVILEVKKPSNKSEMMTEAKPNAKALHELVLYYLRERIEHNNIDIKYLVVTNIYEWFIIDEVWFEKNVFRNLKLKKDFENWKLSGNDTKFFYESIAKPFLETITEKLDCTYFDLRAFENIITNEDKKDDNKLIALYKLLSPVHLLKQPFANDSNTLDTKFYSELLHIIGLEEVKEGSKKLIKRKEKQDPASILENTIMKLEDKDSLRGITNLSTFGDTKKDQLFNVALELSITWINRILFLKLLEAQLFKYHKGNADYIFLNHKTIHDFDELSNLFFQVLAERQSKRREHLKEKFKRVPYLNSSLFERTELERQTFDISGLDNRLELKLTSTTVLKNESGKRKTGELTTLQYLFDFLDAYDFTSEGSEEIQEQNKNLINASVLGLIFEKINGYKDGSFFTPGFVTMYMCRETIRRSVIQKFNEQYKIDCETFDDLKNFIASKFKAKDILEFNKVINELKICDPAVGSGHFLVSALNEVIAIKAELGILADKEGLRLTGYEVKIENDELIVTYNDNTEIFEYSVTTNSITKETQRVQKTLFHEKESIIENSLFGVDINPNSVKICRLRLWIELLKNAYYTEESKFTELETLPNIDINIKCGNSLISRFPLDSDLKKALKGKWNIETYKIAVHSYHEAENKEEKRKLEELIDTIKKDFRTEIGTNDPRKKRLSKLKEELFLKTVSPKLELDIEMKKGGVKLEKEKVKKLTDEINKIEQELKDIENNKIYENAFEWRFEFPEVLDKEGNFNGFDVVIGNPPYGVNFEQQEKQIIFNYYKATDDIYTMFIEKGINITNTVGNISFITPIFWLTGEKYFKTRKLIHDKAHLNLGITLPYDVFTDAYVDTGIYSFSKNFSSEISNVYEFEPREKVDYEILNSLKLDTIQKQEWQNDPELKIVFNNTSRSLLSKLNQFTVKIEDVTKSVRGILADKTEYSEKQKKGQEPVFIGKLDRYFIEPDNFQFIDYGDNLKEKPSSFDFFRGERILIRRIVNRQFRIMASITNEKFVTKKDIYTFKITNSKYTPYLLLAIINSKLISYLKTKGSASAKKDDFTQLTLNDIRQIFIPTAQKKDEERIKVLVNKLLEMKTIENSNVDKIEKELDEIVYGLYKLSDEEIKIIESN
ncbi:MAG: Eco57I restriction-modification methylase domain-containing protein [Sphingobacteriaceae bacterium]|nr:Eco57I restriction-modification methylase domain-containing protein [Sphingobacteriaceae bacterium]